MSRFYRIIRTSECCSLKALQFINLSPSDVSSGTSEKKAFTELRHWLGGNRAVVWGEQSAEVLTHTLKKYSLDECEIIELQACSMEYGLISLEKYCKKKELTVTLPKHNSLNDCITLIGVLSSVISDGSVLKAYVPKKKESTSQQAMPQYAALCKSEVYHRANCRFLSGKSVLNTFLFLSKSNAEYFGLRPCKYYISHRSAEASQIMHSTIKPYEETGLYPEPLTRDMDAVYALCQRQILAAWYKQGSSRSAVSLLRFF